MSSNRDTTLAIIKPDAVKKGYTGKIMTMIDEAGFRIVSMKMTRLTVDQAESFYAEHKGKKFYNGLIQFMISGPIIVMILEKYNAIEAFRSIIGPTDPAEAKENTVRALYGETVKRNAVHGSDSDETAIQEENFFFSYNERFNTEGLIFSCDQ